MEGGKVVEEEDFEEGQCGGGGGGQGEGGLPGVVFIFTARNRYGFLASVLPIPQYSSPHSVKIRGNRAALGVVVGRIQITSPAVTE